MRKFFSSTLHFFQKQNGKKGLDYRMFIYKDSDYLHPKSFWHDIPYINRADNTFNMVIEIPRGESAKMEMSRETNNPIKQDTKKNSITGQTYLRHYKLIPNFNYGFIPQTWENKNIKHFDKYYGDDDPLDILELSPESKRYSIGEVIRVKLIGSFCLIDQDEVDWKILALNENSEKEANSYLSKEENIEKIKDIQKWFKTYKTYEGKKENIILHNDKIFNAEETIKIIEDNHKYYLDLINCKI
jgi:inorganic pyrophosphatase